MTVKDNLLESPILFPPSIISTRLNLYSKLILQRTVHLIYFNIIMVVNVLCGDN